ncbi:CDP-alcohol phosphatidyltransferase family protein [Candidatus Peregrinibacteria bacterium]|nr:CDP-alcohol phosphatidyltransferase family protein [Candidatus Peregrinibacteria bacterium]
MNDTLWSLGKGFFDIPIVYYVLTALVIVILLLWVPSKEWLKRMGSICILIPIGKLGRKLRPLAPNWVTILRFPVVWAGFITYLAGHAYTGFCIMVFGVALDKLDGNIASACGSKPTSFPDTWDELNHPGRTAMGAWLDPFIDKITVLPIAICFCVWGNLWAPFIGVMIGVELIGTLMRHPFNLGEGWQRQTSATWFGKIKFTLQYTTLLAYLPVDQGWVPPSPIPNVVLGLATVFSVLSAMSRIDFRGRLHWINTITDRLSMVFVRR